MIYYYMLCIFFCFMLKTANVVGVRLVGSEMCIRVKYCRLLAFK